MDKLAACCQKLGFKIKDLVGKTFEWKKLTLEGGVTGKDRHYPIKLIKPKR